MNLNKRVDEYIDTTFKGVGQSQQLFDLKQELKMNMNERIRDYQKQGMDDDSAFKEAKLSIGDLSGLVDDMREVGREQARKNIYTSMTNRISTGAIVIGVMAILFGLLMSLSLAFMDTDATAVSGPLVFTAVGAGILVYGILTRETEKRYGMQKVRASLYALSVATIMFAGFVSMTAYFATGEIFIAIAAATIFLVAGVGLLLVLLLSRAPSLKK